MALKLQQACNDFLWRTGPESPNPIQPGSYTKKTYKIMSEIFVQFSLLFAIFKVEPQKFEALAGGVDFSKCILHMDKAFLKIQEVRVQLEAIMHNCKPNETPTPASTDAKIVSADPFLDECVRMCHDYMVWVSKPRGERPPSEQDREGLLKVMEHHRLILCLFQPINIVFFDREPKCLRECPVWELRQVCALVNEKALALLECAMKGRELYLQAR